MKMKRVLAVILAASMVFGATGCMKKSSGKKTVENRKAVEAPEDIWAPYEEEVTLTTAVYENTALVFKEGDDWDNNPWYREYKKDFNINVVNEWVTKDYATKRNLAIAENNVPDVFTVGTQQLHELVDAGMIADLTDLWEKNASDELKAYMEKNPDAFESAKVDGKLYAVPQLGEGDMLSVPVVWVKKDWMAEAGITEFKTVEDFEKMAKTFMEKHGQYGITEISDLSGMFYMAPAWDAHPNIWIEKEDGSIAYGSVQPEMKPVLETYARWYKEGLIDPEFTTTDGDKMFQKVLNEEAGISPFDTWFVWGVAPAAHEKWGTEGTFDAYPIPTATGEPAKASTYFQNYGYNVISKDCPNPEAAIRLMNYYVKMASGGEEEDPELLEALFNVHALPYSLRVFDTDQEYTRYKRINGALPEGSNAETSTWGRDSEQYQRCMKLIEDNNSEGAPEYLMYAKDKCSSEVAANAIDQGLTVKDKLAGPLPPTLAKSGSTLDDILIEGFTKIIVGEKPVEYFDTLVQEWEKAGGEQATKEVNETYGK